MKISIITITYNSAKTLQHTLDSVQSQTYKDIEHILVDGASTDGTQAIIEAYAAKHKNVRYISEPDKGIYDAINKAIRMATGEVIGFLHSDDVYYSTESLELVHQAFVVAQADVTYADLQYCHGEKVIRRWVSNNFDPDSLKYGWMPPHPTMYCRRVVYERVGEYDESLRISADYDMVLRIFNAGYRLYYIPEILVNMQIGGASNRNFSARLAKTLEDFKVLRKNHIGAGMLTVGCKQLHKIRQFTRKD